MNTETTYYNNQFNNPFRSTTPTPPLHNPAFQNLQNDLITLISNYTFPDFELVPQPPQSQPLPHHNRRVREPSFPHPNPSDNLHYPPQPITNPNPNPLQQNNQSSYNPHYPTQNIHPYNHHSNQFSPFFRHPEHHHMQTHAPITIQINCTNCNHTNDLMITGPQVLTTSTSRSSSSLTSSSTN